MTMQRKPPLQRADDMEAFIGKATAEKPSLGEPASSDKKHAQETFTPDVNVNVNVNVNEAIGKGSRFEACFKRETFYVHKDLVKALNKKAAKGGKGEKTRIINRALQLYLAAGEP